MHAGEEETCVNSSTNGGKLGRSSWVVAVPEYDELQTLIDSVSYYFLRGYFLIVDSFHNFEVEEVAINVHER
jgi:hypothetical protein